MATQFSENENPHWRKTFFPIWIGQAISLIGSRMVGFALVWFLTEQTGSAIVLTMASLAGLLPEMILSPFAGALTDRWNRQKVMILADSAIAVVTLGLALLFIFDLVEIWHIYVLMFARSIGGAFHYPAMSASTSLMVPKERLTKIQGLNQLLQGILTVVAAPLGALALEYLSIGKIMFIDIFTAILAVAPLFIVTIPQPDVNTTDEQRANPIKTMWEDVVEGMRYMYHWKGLFYVMLLATGINAILNPAFNLLPLLVKETFGLGAPELASVETAMGIGLMAGSLILGAWGGFKKKVYTSILGLMTGSIGLLMIAFAPTSSFWMIIVGISIFGVTNAITNGPLFAIFQTSVELNMQGRIFSLINTMAMAVSPIGMIVAGPVSEWFGVQTWFVVAVVYIFFMCTVMFFSPAIKNLEEGSPSKLAAAEVGSIEAAAE